MITSREAVRLQSLGQELSGILCLPKATQPVPVVILCHGAGEFKENYFELAEVLGESGVASFAFDFHGHGQSGGARFNVKMSEWVPDVQAALDFLATHPGVDGNRIAAFGLSSGGTAILEAAIVDPRLKALVVLDGTVRNSLPLGLTLFMKSLVALGQIKKAFTGRDLLLPLAKLSGGIHLASDPEVDARITADPRAQEVYGAFPFPGGAEAFFVDTIERVSAINAPTLIIWGEEDKLDSPETARLLHAALTCKKKLDIIPGNGHAGHLDRHKSKVFALTAEWVLQNLGTAQPAKPVGPGRQNATQNNRSGGSQESGCETKVGAPLAVSQTAR